MKLIEGREKEVGYSRREREGGGEYMTIDMGLLQRFQKKREKKRREDR